MDYRKIIKFGANSHIISLPQAWIKKYKLVKGDTLFLEVIGNSIVVSASEEKQPDKKTSTIPITEKTSTKDIKRLLISAYENNATTIIFSGEHISKFTKDINALVESYIALEIVEHSEKNITCKAYIKTDEVKIQTFIRRIDNTIKAMAQELIKQTETNQDQSSEKNFRENIKEDIKARTKNINKIVRMLRRVIKERLYRQRINENDDPLALLKYWRITTHLEYISDNIKNISQHMTQEDYNEDKFEKLFHEALQIYEKIMKTFYKKDSTQAYKNSTLIKGFGSHIRTCQEGKVFKPIVLETEFFKENMKKINQLSY